MGSTITVKPTCSWSCKKNKNHKKLSDCQRGVVFDGIETTFLSSIPVALQTVLKALNNRKYIYVLNTKFTHEQYEIREVSF